MDHIVVHCECGETLRIRAQHAGRSGQCRGCLRDVVIPSLDVIEQNLGREVSLKGLHNLPHAFSLGDRSTLADSSFLGNQSSDVTGDANADDVPVSPDWRSPMAADAVPHDMADEQAPSRTEEQASVAAQLWQPGHVVDERYEVLQLLGQGAYGAVWKVHHKEWDLDLAVKELRTDKKMTKQRRENFVREAQTWVDDIGMHPHVVTAWYVRELEEVPYLFLEYCDGGDLASWIRDGRTRDLKIALDIAIQLAWGLAHCHERGVVHRDFKPDNVMMTAGGMAKITDFGLVKLSVLEDEEQDDTGDSDGRQQTISAGRLLGTPSYMPPEQWVPGGQIDRRADLHALGVTIYELLTGQQPIHLPTRSGFPDQRIWLDACREAHERDQPSLLIEKRDDVPAELAQLVLACLAKQADDRPTDANVVAQMLLQIYEAANGEPHGRPTPGEIQPLADGLNNQGVSLFDLRKVNEAKRRFEAALESAPQHLEATYNLGLLRWRKGEVTDARLIKQLRGVSASQPGQHRVEYMLAQIHIERADYQSALVLLALALESVEEASVNETEIRRSLTVVRETGHGEQCGRYRRTFEERTNEVTSVSFSADGRYAVSGSQDKTLKLWDVKSGECPRTFEGHTETVTSVTFSVDDRFVLSGSEDKTLKLWDTRSGECQRTFEGHTERVNSVSFSTDGRHALSGSLDKTLKLWDVKSGECLRTFEGHTDWVYSVSISADGCYALSGSRDKTLKLWDTRSGECLRTFEGHTDWVTSVSFSADSSYALSASCDKTLKLWDAKYGECLRTFEGHTERVNSVSFSRNGRSALSGSDDKTLKLWDVKSGVCLRTFEGRTNVVTSVSFSADGRYAVSASHELSGSLEKPLHLWQIGRPGSTRAAFQLTPVVDSQTLLQTKADVGSRLRYAELSVNEGEFRQAATHLRHARAAASSARRPELLKLWTDLYTQLPRTEFRGGWNLRTFEGHKDVVCSASFSADGRYALSGSWDHTLKLWDVKSGKCLRTFEGHTDFITSVSFSADGRYVLSGSWDKTLKLWDAKCGECLRTFEGHTSLVNSVSFSADGRCALSGGGCGLKLWDVKSGVCLRTFDGLKRGIASVAFSADGRYALSGSEDLKLWNVQSGQCLRTFEGHTSLITSVSFSANGCYALSGRTKKVGSGSTDNTLELWDVQSGECLRTFEGHTTRVTSVSFSADGRYALSGSDDCSLTAGLVDENDFPDPAGLCLWDAKSGEWLRTLEGHTAEITSVSFSADGRYALSASADNTLKLWFLDWELDNREPADWDDAALPWLQNFLTLHTPPEAELPQDREPTEDEIRRALTRQGKPKVTKKDFARLLHTLGCAGFGWLRPEGVKQKLLEVAADWTGPPLLGGE